MPGFGDIVRLPGWIGFMRAKSRWKIGRTAIASPKARMKWSQRAMTTEEAKRFVEDLKETSPTASDLIQPLVKPRLSHAGLKSFQMKTLLAHSPQGQK